MSDKELDTGQEHPMARRLRNFLDSLHVLIFREKGFGALLSMSGPKVAVIAFLVCVGFQSLPTSGEEVALYGNLYVFYAVKFVIALGLIYGVMRLLGSMTSIRQFVSTSAITYTYAMVVTTLLAYASILLFDQILNLTVIAGVITSFIPYYTSVLFGWCCENISGVSGKWKPVVVGLFSITVLLAYILYVDPLLCSAGIMDVFGISSVLCG